jgi:hypothetical protein
VVPVGLGVTGRCDGLGGQLAGQRDGLVRDEAGVPAAHRGGHEGAGTADGGGGVAGTGVAGNMSQCRLVTV